MPGTWYVAADTTAKLIWSPPFVWDGVNNSVPPLPAGLSYVTVSTVDTAGYKTAVTDTPRLTLSQRLTCLEQEVLNQSADKLAGVLGTGTLNAGLGIGGSANVVCTFSRALPSTNYEGLPFLGASTGIGTLTPQIPVTNKTTTTCTVSVRNNGLALGVTASIVVLAIFLE